MGDGRPEGSRHREKTAWSFTSGWETWKKKKKWENGKQDGNRRKRKEDEEEVGEGSTFEQRHVQPSQAEILKQAAQLWQPEPLNG